jgi:hypothetical protein
VYKVVETSTVVDEVLEGLINEWVTQGWSLEDIRFVVKDSSHRPVMAFILFTRTQGGVARGSAARAQS